MWRRSRGGDGELLEERGGAPRSPGVTTDGDITSWTSSMLWDELRELLGEYLADLGKSHVIRQVTEMSQRIGAAGQVVKARRSKYVRRPSKVTLKSELLVSTRGKLIIGSKIFIKSKTPNLNILQ